MGLFQWLGSLLDQLISWLGRAVAAFLEGLIWGIQRLWEGVILGVLIAAFAHAPILFVIFYAGLIVGETMMEVWDPRYANSQRSEVFSLRQAPQTSPLPQQRSNARIMQLENWR